MAFKGAPTLHNEAQLGDIAPVVLMPGDPLRAKFIAQNYLKNYKQVNGIRGMLAYTGDYEGVRLSVMGHGMGLPSIGIYSYELFSFYNVDTIIRVGSSGGYLEENELGDVVIANEAVSYSNFAELMGITLQKQYHVNATKSLVDKAVEIAKQNNIKYFLGTVNSKDAFYGVTNGQYIDGLIKEKKIIAAEMEAYALYINAIKTNKKALTLLTISDSIVKDEAMTPIQTQTSFNSMIKLALELAKSEVK